MRSVHIFIAFGLLVLLCASSFGQGRPDIVWMRGAHTRYVDGIAFSPDGALLASVGGGEIRIWRVADGALLQQMWGYGWQTAVMSVAFAPDSSLLATTDGGLSAKLWRVTDGQLVRTLTQYPSSARSVAFSPDGQTVAVGAGPGDGVPAGVQLWRVSDGAIQYNLATGAYEAPISLAFSPDGGLLVGAGSALWVWRVADHVLTDTLQGTVPVAFSPDGMIFVSRVDIYIAPSWWAGICVRRVSDLAQTSEFPVGHSVRGLAVARDGLSVVSGEGYGPPEDLPLGFWRLSDGAALARFDDETSVEVDSVAVSPDGSHYAYGRVDGVVVLARNPFVRLTGSVKLAGWGGGPSSLDGRPVQVTAGDLPPATVSMSATDAPDIGSIVLPVSASGAYGVRVKPAGFLSHTTGVSADHAPFAAEFLGPDGASGFIPGDVTDDNRVDDADLIALVRDFGGPPSTNTPYTDTNGDGFVDDADLINVVAAFGLSGD